MTHQDLVDQALKDHDITEKQLVDTTGYYPEHHNESKLLLVERTDNGEWCLTWHNRYEELVDYHVHQEYASDWNVEAVYEMGVGRLTNRVLFGTPHTPEIYL